MGASDEAMRWLTRTESEPWWSLSGRSHADVLDVMAECDDPGLRHRLRRARLRALALTVLEAGPIDVPRRPGVRRGSAAAEQAPLHEELALVRLCTAASDAVDAGERQEDRALRMLAGLLRAPAGAWGEALRSWDAEEMLTDFGALMVASFAVMAGDTPRESERLEEAARLSPAGTPRRMSYRAVLAATLWRAGRNEAALEVVDEAFGDADENGRWLLLNDLCQIGNGICGAAAAASGGVAAERLLRRFIAESPRGGDGEKSLTVAGGRLRVLQNILANALAGHAFAGDWESVLRSWEEVATVTNPVDGGAWARGLRVHALLELDRPVDALDALDDDVRGRSTARLLAQPRRMDAIRACSGTAATRDRLTQPAPPGLEPAARAEAVVLAATGLVAAARDPDAARLIEFELSGPLRHDDSAAEVAAFASERMLTSDESTWVSLVDTLIAHADRREAEGTVRDDQWVERLLTGRSLRALFDGRLDEALRDAMHSMQVASRTGGTPGGRRRAIEGARRALTNVADRARAADRLDLVETAAAAALVLGDPVAASAPPRELLDHANALTLVGRKDEALAAAAGIVRRAGGDRGLVEDTVRAVFEWIEPSITSDDELAQSALADIESILVETGGHDALLILRTHRFRWRWIVRDLEGAISDAEEVLPSMSQSDAREQRAFGVALTIVGMPAELESRWATAVLAAAPAVPRGAPPWGSSMLRARAAAMVGDWSATLDEWITARDAARTLPNAEGDSLLFDYAVSIVAQQGPSDPDAALALLDDAVGWRGGRSVTTDVEARRIAAVRLSLGGRGAEEQMARAVGIEDPAAPDAPSRRREAVRHCARLLLRAAPALERPLAIGEPAGEPRSTDRPRVVGELRHHVARITRTDPEIVQEVAVAELVAAGSAEDHDWWAREAAQWQEVEPLSPFVADVLAIVATTAGDHRGAADALAAGARLSTDTSQRITFLRARAGALVRAGDPAAAVGHLAEDFREQADPGGEPHALTLLSDLLRLAGVPGVDPDVGFEACEAALRAWEDVAGPADIPSSAVEAPGWVWGNADVKVRRLALNPQVFPRRPALLHERSAAFIALYPNDPFVGRARMIGAIALWGQDRNVEAIRALDAALQSMPPDGGPDLRRAILLSVRVDEPDAVAVMEGPIPETLTPVRRLGSFTAAAHRLDEWGLPEAAARVIAREAMRPDVASAEAVGGLIAEFVDERIKGTVWEGLADAVLDGADTARFGAGLRRALLWSRAHRRHRAGDDAGAVADALALTLAEFTGTGAGRRNARTMLATARGWVRDDSEALERVLQRELAIGPPPGDPDPARHADELAQWADAVTAAGRSPIDARWVALHSAIEVGEPDRIGPAVTAVVTAYRTAAQNTGQTWERTLSRLIDVVGESHAPSQSTLLFHRAHHRNKLGDEAGAREDVAAALALARRGGLPGYRFVDVMRVAGDALTWRGVDAAQRVEWAQDIVQVSADFVSDAPAHGCHVHDRRAQALSVLGRPEEALAELRLASEFADALGDPARRDGLLSTLGGILHSDVARPADPVRALIERWAWHRGSPSADPFAMGGWVARALRERGAHAAACEVWHRLGELLADGPSGESLLRSVIGEAELTITDLTASTAYLAVAASFRIDRTSFLEAMEASVLAVLSGARGTVDEAAALLARAERAAARVEDPQERLRACLITLLRGRTIGLEGSLRSPASRAITADLRAGARIPDDLFAVAQSGLPDLLGAEGDLVPARARFPRIQSTSAQQLSTILEEQYSRWSPGDVLAQEVLDWVDALRARAIEHPQDAILVIHAQFYWASMRWQQLPLPRALPPGDSAARDALDDAHEEVLGAAREGIALAREHDLIWVLSAASGMLVLAASVAEMLHDGDRQVAAATWIFDAAVAEGLRVDARAAASRYLDRRQQLLALSDAAWSVALLCAALLDSSVRIADVIAVHRSSLILDGPAREPVAVDAAALATLVALSGADSPDPSGEELDAQEQHDAVYARAASASVLAGVDGSARIAVRPRPLVRLPDGRLALHEQVRALTSTQRESWLSPSVISISD